MVLIALFVGVEARTVHRRAIFDGTDPLHAVDSPQALMRDTQSKMLARLLLSRTPATASKTTGGNTKASSASVTTAGRFHVFLARVGDILRVSGRLFLQASGFLLVTSLVTGEFFKFCMHVEQDTKEFLRDTNLPPPSGTGILDAFLVIFWIPLLIIQITLLPFVVLTSIILRAREAVINMFPVCVLEIIALVALPDASRARIRSLLKYTGAYAWGGALLAAAATVLAAYVSDYVSDS